MDGQLAVQGVILIRAAIDAIKSLLALRPPRRLPDVIPVYRLVSRDELLRARSDLAIDVTEMRWPRYDRRMTSDLDIYRAARLWLGQHGDDAVAMARRKVAELQTAGQRDGADVWLRIIVAIETLLTPRTGTQ